MNNYKICTKCIMDTSDRNITFNEHGVCNHCDNFEKYRRPKWFPNKQGKIIMDNKILDLKTIRKNFEYDCMIGLSGGVDSSYLAYFLKKNYNLRMLAVHVDTGWNSELAVSNIEKIVKKLNIDLYTVVVDWQEMRDLQVAFLKSGVVNQDTPQDHAIFAGVHKVAKKFKIKNFFVGQNIQTESVLPTSWQGLSAMDTKQLIFISNKFGKRKLKKFPLISFFDLHVYFPRIYGYETFIPLNHIPYNKDKAKSIIKKKLNWQDYGVKHGESKWTKYFQSYFLPTKCGYDKRRAHLSSLILACEITRAKALKEISKPVYKSNRELEDDIEFVCKKLKIKKKEMIGYIYSKSISYTNYPNHESILKIIRYFKKLLKIK